MYYSLEYSLLYLWQTVLHSQVYHKFHWHSTTYSLPYPTLPFTGIVGYVLGFTLNSTTFLTKTLSLTDFAILVCHKPQTNQFHLFCVHNKKEIDVVTFMVLDLLKKTKKNRHHHGHHKAELNFTEMSHNLNLAPGLVIEISKTLITNLCGYKGRNLPCQELFIFSNLLSIPQRLSILSLQSYISGLWTNHKPQCFQEHKKLHNVVCG